MGDPQRLLSSMQDDDELSRELLGSLRDVGPNASAKHETWKKIAVSTAAVATIGTGSAAVQALGRSGAGVLANAAKIFTTKVAIGVAIAGTTAAGGAFVVHQRQPAQSSAPEKIQVPAPIAVPFPPSAPIAEPAPMEPLPVAEPAAPALSPPAHKFVDRAPKSDGDRARRDSLALESRMLTDARAHFHAGDPRGALATLEQLRARSPKGVLTQERDVLTIQILSSLGDAAGAQRKAKEFVAAYPESPHAPQMRRLATGG